MKLRSLLTSSILTILSFPAFANPVISEFMADNSSTIADEDGAYGDWIEIHNPTNAPINLENWVLRNGAYNLATFPAGLTSWVFPAVTIQPGEFIVVWADGKNRRTPGSPLHTNFSLSANGEHLSLVNPAGTQVQAFGNEYPSQRENESYGYQFTYSTILNTGAAAKYLVPSNGSLGTTWTANAFNDAAWTSGNTGHGFGILVSGMTIRQVKKNQAAYGGVGNLAQADELFTFAPGAPQVLADATIQASTLNILGDSTDGHYGGNIAPPAGAPNDYYAVKATGYLNITTPGTYTFGLNSDDGGRIRINGANVMVDDTTHGPADHLGTYTFPTAGLYSFEALYFENAGGDEGEFYAAFGTFASWDAVNFKLVGDTANGGIATLTEPQGVGAGILATNVQTPMLGVNPGIYIRTPFSSAGPGAATTAQLKMRYADGFVASINGIEVARRNAPVGALAYNAAATGTRTNLQAVTREHVNATAALASLSGSNVLAVHGLNNTAADGAFFNAPELTIGNINLAGDIAFFGGGKATPGGINETFDFFGKVADTQFSVDRGFYTAPISVAITTTTPSSFIRYTTDASTPTETTGTLYTGPINISSTTTLRARAFRAGWEPTDVDTQTYIFLDDVILQSANGAAPAGWPAAGGGGGVQIMDYGMDPDIVNNGDINLGGATTVKNALKAIPTMSIVTDQGNLTNPSTGIYLNPGNRGFAWEKPASVEFIAPPNVTYPNGYTEFQINCGIRIRGGYSRSTDNPKHGFHLLFRSDYGASKLNYDVFGRHGTDEYDEIDVRTAQNYSWSFGGDSRNTFLREESSRQAGRDMGSENSRNRYFHVYINGQYWGLHTFDERPEAPFAASYFGGNKDDYDCIKGEQAAGYTTDAAQGNLAAWTDLWNKCRAHSANPSLANYFVIFGKQADGITPHATAENLLDADNCIDYLLLSAWMGNLDGCVSNFLGNDQANNWFTARKRNGGPNGAGFRFFVHDYEHTLLNTGEDRTGPYWVTNTNPNDNGGAHYYTLLKYSNPLFMSQDLGWTNNSAGSNTGPGNLEWRLKWADRIHKHMFNGGQLTQTPWTNRINALAAVIDTAIVAESARWGDSKSATPFNRNHWLTEKNTILSTYLPVRGTNVLNQLKTDGLYPTLDAPVFTQNGGYIAGGSQIFMAPPVGITYNGTTTMYYTTDGSDPRLPGGALSPTALPFSSSVNTETLIAGDATVWRVRDDGVNLGNTQATAPWRGPGYDDSASPWRDATAEAGFGDSDEYTVSNPASGLPSSIVGQADIDPVTAGTQRPVTTYYRKNFNVTNVGGISKVTVTLKYDDGGIVYINGTPVTKTGNISYDAAFNQTTSSSAENLTHTDTTISPSVLVEGDNVITCEIHQSSTSVTDVSFKLSLVVERLAANQNPMLVGTGGAKTFKARAHNTAGAVGNVWSALNEFTFYANTEAATSSNLAISEIMYHPAAPSAGEIAAGHTDQDDFEYVEFQNIGNKHVDLRGCFIYGSIKFNFDNNDYGPTLPPGARVLIVSKKSAFEARYGTGKPIAGSYKGHLNNAGETFVFQSPTEAVLRSVAFQTSGAWPTTADGQGYSLIRKNPDANLPADSDGSYWRASLAVGGNPGASDAVQLAAWKTTYGVTSDTEDNDNDGLNALQEYAFGSLPGTSSPDRIPVLGSQLFTVGPVTSNYATITFRRVLGADNVAISVEGATSLTTPDWSTANAVLVSSIPNGDGTETVRYRSANPISLANPQQYLRVRTTSVP